MLKVHCKETGQMFGRTKKHLQDVNMTYWQHFRFVLSCLPYLFFATIFFIIHAIIPGLFTNTASSIVSELDFKLLEGKK